MCKPTNDRLLATILRRAANEVEAGKRHRMIVRLSKVLRGLKSYERAAIIAGVQMADQKQAPHHGRKFGQAA